jgi:hypothetical protein
LAYQILVSTWSCCWLTSVVFVTSAYSLLQRAWLIT